ncbi:MAG: phosphate ABC transporter substrate-binding protein, partial [Lachnospiraceae bacterium]|nr:phosphate ABC transporter substrate-binding protein [Lachnospiraceae bacterium]
AVVMMMCGVTACGGEGENSGSNLSGTISLNGSTSMQKVANALQEGFMKANPNVTVNVEFTGSGTGIQAAIDGTADIGNSSRNLKDAEKEAGLVENIIAIDGIAVIVDNANKVSDITSEELAKIYTGAITNWSELGGANQPIVVVGRESGSGTRGAFEELLEIEDKCDYAQEIDSTGGVLSTVASTAGAIGYVSLDVIDDTVTVMAIDGVVASEENIVAGSYSLSRPFVMATKGEISAQNELVQAFFAYIESEEGQAIIKKVGLILPE